MKKFIKLFAVAMLLALMPAKSFSQWTQPVNNEVTIAFNITDIANFDERVFFLYNLTTDGRFDVINGERDGFFIISASNNFEGINLAEAFADFREQNTANFNMMSKEQAAEVAAEYKGDMPYQFISSLMMDYYIRSRQNNTCANADPFCTDNGMYEFPAGVNAGSGESGPDYSCLYTQPNPAWYYMRILNPGNIDIYMYSTPSHDIDFCCWGPFVDPVSPCPNGLTSDKVVSCSYSAAATEHCLIPSTAQTGEYYILVITNYSNQTCNINFSKVAGTGTTDCGILPPMVDNDGPYCVGETIHLTANGQAGATYSWSGPGGFTSNQQNPTRPNCTMAMAGTYTCTITVGSQTNSATTEIVVYPQPTANFNYTSVCRGTPTQFTSTSTTSPSGQQIQSYQWNFGDGQTGTGQNVTHTYANAGNYTVTLTTSCGDGHCTSTKTQTVPVYATPTASASAMPNTVIYGGVATLSASAGTTGSFNFHWEPANKVVNPNNQTTQTVMLYETTTFTVTVTHPQGGCSSTAQVTVSMEGSNMTAMASADAYELCEGESTTLHAQPSGGTGNYTYNWTPANTLNDPSSQNPTATPPVGTTTYTCAVSDGITNQNVTVTIIVHPIEETHEYDTICQGDTISFHGLSVSTPNTYQYQTQTEYGCDKTMYLHLANWQTYDETTITEYICDGESYSFYGTSYNYTCQVAYTDHTHDHGCDSIVRLNLTKWDPNPIISDPRDLCIGDTLTWIDGNKYYHDCEVYYDSIDSHGCPQVYKLELTVGEYQTPPINVWNPNQYICYPHGEDPYYYWDIADREYSGNAIDSVIVANPSGCDYKYRLNLRFHEEFYDERTVETCDEYYWNITGQHYNNSGRLEKHFTRPFGDTQCDSTYILNLIIHDSISHIQLPEDLVHIHYEGVVGCDSARWDNRWYTSPAPINQPYKWNYQTHFGCDSTVYFPLTLEYTPSPYEISPVDYNNTAPHWVVTATEFQINSYDFSILEKDHPACHWDSINWHFVKKLNNEEWEDDPSIHWILEEDGTTMPTPNMICKMYVLNYIPDTVWLAATIYNKCAPEGVTQLYWFVSSFYGMEEMESSLANFDVIPNPNNGQMQLNFEYLTGKVTIKVYDMKGSLIDNFETYNDNGPNSYLYNMKRKTEGIYFFVATSKEGTVAKKVVIQR